MSNQIIRSWWTNKLKLFTKVHCTRIKWHNKDNWNPIASTHWGLDSNHTKNWDHGLIQLALILHMAICNPWQCRWWVNEWCPVGSPPKSGSERLWSPGQSVVLGSVRWTDIQQHIGAQLNLGHQCLPHPGNVFTAWTNMAGHFPTQGGTQGRLHQHKVCPSLWEFHPSTLQQSKYC